MASLENSQADRVKFGPFLLTPTQRLLEQDGIAVPLGGRALDILIVLVERAGEIVGKRDLVERVWPDVTVDEGSLRFHVGALRKALGDGQDGARYVTTVPGRGYCFVAPVSRQSASGPPAGADHHALDQSRRLPARLARMVGRDETVRTVSARLVADRFVTIVGPGGIGKTTVAVSVVHALLAEFAGAVRFIDLGTLGDPRLVASNLSSALGLPVGSDDATPTLISYLRDKRMLLLFDSCEHVIEAVAELTERLFMEAPLIHILATSREALRVEGEHVYRLFPLDYPPDDAGLTALEALSFPAVQLFMGRVAASMQKPTLSDDDARIVAEICRKLDGIALAIELAAGRVAVYGIHGTVALLDDRLGLLWQGRRTAPPRHQTLNATLDWSYNLLPEIERAILSNLAIFAGSFKLKAAQSVAMEGGLPAADLAEVIAHLVDKSLISTVLGGGEARYRLLDTTCAYAKQRLIESGSFNNVARRHAAYFQASLEADGAGVSELFRPDHIAGYADQVANIRGALKWCFSAEGDSALGIALAAAASPALFSMSLWQECQHWTEQAIATLDDESRGTRRELALQTALGMSLLARHDPSDAPRAALTRALLIAEDLNDAGRQIRLLSELRVMTLFSGDARGALQFALRSKVIADTTDDPEKAALSEAELAISHYVVGNQADAQRHCEAALGRVQAMSPGRPGHFVNDIFVQTRCALASALWLRGFPDKGGTLAKQIIDGLKDAEDALLVSNSLLWIIPVFLWSGDWWTAEKLIDRLTKNAQDHAFEMVVHIGVGLRGQLLIGRGDVNPGTALIQKCQDALPVKAFQVSNIISVASGLAAGGDFESALLMIDQVIPEEDGDGWSQLSAEILRVKGDILACAPKTDPNSVEQCLSIAAVIAREQSALSWELRIATSLATLWRKQGRSKEARNMLASVYGRFTEGFNTVDLIAAKRLLDKLA